MHYIYHVQRSGIGGSYKFTNKADALRMLADLINEYNEARIWKEKK